MRLAWPVWAAFRKEASWRRIQRDVEAAWLRPRGDGARARRGLRRLKQASLRRLRFVASLSLVPEFAEKSRVMRLREDWRRFREAVLDRREGARFPLASSPGVRGA